MSIDVSVIITTYNVERYIERAINSVLVQKDISFEIIVVDDCSTDDTWSIISNLSDERIKSFQLSQNGGPSTARNKAIEECSGDWIAVLDGDDSFDDHRLCACLAKAKENHANLIIDNLTIYRESDGEKYPMFSPERFSHYDILSLAQYIEGNSFNGKGYPLGYTKPFISREFINKHNLRYDPEIRIGEDYIFMAEALALGAVCRVEQSAGYLYTVRTGSISHRLTPEDMRVIQDIDEKFLAKHKLDNEALKAQKKRHSGIKDTYAFTLLVDALKNKNVKGIFKALRISPTSPRHLSEALFKRLGIVKK